MSYTISQRNRLAINKVCFRWCLAECKGNGSPPVLFGNCSSCTEGSQTGLSLDETQTAHVANPCVCNGLSLAALEEILSLPQAPLRLFPFLQSPLTQSALNSEQSHHCAESHPQDNISHTVILVSALGGNILDNAGPRSFSDQRMKCGVNE